MKLDPLATRFFLNLDRRTDRRAVTERTFQSIGLPVERFTAVDGKDCRVTPTKWTAPGRRAVAASFVKMLRAAKCRRAPQLEVYEDDVVFHPDFHNLLSQVHLPEDWDIFYLGGVHLLKPISVDGIIVKARKIIGNHAMIFRDRVYGTACKRIVTPPDRYAVDKDIRLSILQQTLNVYAPVINLAWQRPEFSDLQHREVSYFRADGSQLSQPTN